MYTGVRRLSLLVQDSGGERETAIIKEVHYLDKCCFPKLHKEFQSEKVRYALQNFSGRHKGNLIGSPKWCRRLASMHN